MVLLVLLIVSPVAAGVASAVAAAAMAMERHTLSSVTGKLHDPRSSSRYQIHLPVWFVAVDVHFSLLTYLDEACNSDTRCLSASSLPA